MAMNTDHFHTHDNFKIAGKIIDQVSALKQRNAELEEKVEELTGELRIARPTFKCAECGEVGPHKWVWNGKEGADFVARRCCDKCINEKGLTLWPRVHSCEEKCKEFNALKAENEKLRSCLKCLDYRDLIKDSPEKKSVKELIEELK